MSKKFPRRKNPTLRMPMPTRVGLVVLGMHRSGTSALAGTIGLMGADLPADLMEGTSQNPKGFFESNRIAALNEDLLKSAGQSWWSLPRFPCAWYRSPAYDTFMARALVDIETEFGASSLFVLKDPRICRLLPFWDEALRRFGSTPHYVLTWRHPLEVAASVEKQANYYKDFGLELWLRHVLDAEHGSRGHPRVFTSYAAVLADWRHEMTRVSDGLNLKWPRSFDKAGPEIDAFLSRGLQTVACPALDEQAEVRKGCHAAVVEILTRWSRNGEDPKDHARLDSIRKTLNDAEPILVSALEEGQAAHLSLQDAGRRLAAVSDERDRYREAAETLGAERDTLRSTLAQRAQELEDIYRQQADERDELVAARVRLGKLERLRRRGRVHMDDLVSRLSNAVPADQLTEIRDGLMAELSRVQAKAEAAEAERQRQHAALEALSRQAEEQRRDLVAEAEALRTAFESSRSWRATAFLRRIRLGLRRR